MENLPPTYVEGFHDLDAVQQMKYNTLGKTGLIVSKLSFGGGPLGVHYGTFDEDEAIDAIRQAIRRGVNYIDTSPWYGQGRSEAVIGKALNGIPREAYYISTKVGRYELDHENMFDFSVEKTRKSIDRSLKLLGLDYIDVIQVHDIEFAPSLDVVITQTLPELSRQVAQKKARFIGITGYPISILQQCIERSNINISCVLTYSRYNLIDESLRQYLEFFKNQDIGVICAAAFACGLLTNKATPEWHPADDNIKKACAEAVQYCVEGGMDLARYALWWAFQLDEVATHLVGMQTRRQLDMNMKMLTDDLREDEQEILADLRRKYFEPMKDANWEGKEIESYWSAMKIDREKYQRQKYFL